MTGAHYEIVVNGRLGAPFTSWFEELEVRASGPDGTYLYGWFADQAALQAILMQLGELGLELSSVRRLPEDE